MQVMVTVSIQDSSCRDNIQQEQKFMLKYHSDTSWIFWHDMCSFILPNMAPKQELLSKITKMSFPEQSL